MYFHKDDYKLAIKYGIRFYIMIGNLGSIFLLFGYFINKYEEKDMQNNFQDEKN